MVIDGNGNKWYKVGLHIHTTLSDGARTPEAAIARYREEGYDAIALTDHWHYGAGCQQDGMLILAGCEYNAAEHDGSACVMHIVGVGMETAPDITRQTPYPQVVERIRACGGLPILAHPAWSMNTLDHAKSLPGIVHTEVYNAVSEAHQSVRAYSEFFVDMCANEGIYYGLLATDDTHYYDGSDDCKGWVMVRAEDCSRQAILQALEAGDYYASQGPELYVKREGDCFCVECSPCAYVAAVTNSAWTDGRVLRGEGLTRFTYQVQPIDKWVRIQVCDGAGKLAWSRVYKV